MQLGACAGQIVPLLIVAALVVWGGRVAKKHRTRGWQIAMWLPLLALGFYFVGLLLTISGLIDAFGAVAFAPAAERATLLSEGIASAMWSTTLGGGTTLAIWVGCAIAFTIGSLRPRAGADAPKT